MSTYAPSPADSATVAAAEPRCARTQHGSRRQTNALRLRRRFPAGTLYLICDNYGPHTKTEVRAWCAAHDIELVYTPTNASWLNWIESEFTAIRYFTLDGRDYPSHNAQQAAIAGYIRWRNRHCHPKRHFAIGSKIRRPNYLPNVA